MTETLDFLPHHIESSLRTTHNSPILLSLLQHWGEPHDGCSCNHRHHGRGRRWAHFIIPVGVTWQNSQRLIFSTRYSPSKEEALQSLMMSLSTIVVWLFDAENIRRHDGCNKWCRWLQLIFREGWRGLHDNFDKLVALITKEICFRYFLN